MAKTKSKNQKLTLRTYLKALSDSITETFEGKHFKLKSHDAQKAAEMCMKIIRRNHLRARRLGLINY